MAPQSLFVVVLWAAAAFTSAVPAAPGHYIFTRDGTAVGKITPLDDYENTLNTSDVASTKFTSSSTTTSNPFSSGDEESPASTDETPVRDVCLHPKGGHEPIPEDCRDLCDIVHKLQGPISLKPFHQFNIHHKHCDFGVANLSPCSDLHIDPASKLGAYCNKMYFDCVVHHYDGYLRYKDPDAGLALTGLDAAPPYEREQCHN